MSHDAARVAEDERALLVRLRQGEDAAWATLFATHAPSLRLYLRATIGARDDLDDIVQRVFLECFRTLERFREEASLATWLHRIAHNMARREARTWFRWWRRRNAYAELHDGHTENTAEQHVAAREQLALLERALQRIDYRLSAVWVLREIQGFSPEETATALGVACATVRTRHHRARQRLAVELATLETQPGRPSATPHPHRRTAPGTVQGEEALP